MFDTPCRIVYPIKVMLSGVSPAIWRRLPARSNTTIAALHFILQIAMGWTDSHLHRFLIHGKEQGIEQIGGIRSAPEQFCSPRHIGAIRY